jgi:acyl-coenzyme A thioesterase PaaI-like protein
VASVLERLSRTLGKPRLFKWLLTLYPPYLGAGVRVTHVSKDLRRIDVAMRLGRLNRNYVGTQFGGSLYSMCDPFFMLMLMENLGPEFIVWDKAASIRFLKPGRGTVTARFEISSAQIEELRRAAERGKVEPEFEVEVKDATGEAVARVHKTLHIRRKGAGLSPRP